MSEAIVRLNNVDKRYVRGKPALDEFFTRNAAGQGRVEAPFEMPECGNRRLGLRGLLPRQAGENRARAQQIFNAGA